mgnify:CR=1 FL=1
MQIEISTVPIDDLFKQKGEDLAEVIEENGLKTDEKSLFYRIVTATTDALGSLYKGVNIDAFDNEFLQLAKQNDFQTHEDATIPITCVLYSDPGICAFFGVPSTKHVAPMGFFACSTGWELFGTEEQYYADDYKIFVCTDESPLKSSIEETRELSKSAFDTQKVARQVFDFLYTLTHEFSHALEFIEHTAGMSPLEASYVAEDLEIPFQAASFGAHREFGTGRLCALSIDELDDMMDEDDWLVENTDNMEERIEEKGRELFHRAMAHSPALKNLVDQYIDQWVSEYLPTEPVSKTQRKPSALGL